MRVIDAVRLFAPRIKVGRVAFFDLALGIYCLVLEENPIWSQAFMRARLELFSKLS